MSRYIDADPFEREMYHAAFETDTDMQRWDSGCWIRYKLFENILEQQPTADVRENKRGEWVKLTGMMPPELFGRHQCSECDEFALHDWKHHKEQLTDFCPNCGADMRGGKDERTD